MNESFEVRISLNENLFSIERILHVTTRNLFLKNTALTTIYALHFRYYNVVSSFGGNDKIYIYYRVQ